MRPLHRRQWKVWAAGVTAVTLGLASASPASAFFWPTVPTSTGGNSQPTGPTNSPTGTVPSSPTTSGNTGGTSSLPFLPTPGSVTGFSQSEAPGTDTWAGSGSTSGVSASEVVPGRNTPEPATLLLGLIGTGVAGALGWRRKKVKPATD